MLKRPKALKSRLRMQVYTHVVSCNKSLGLISYDENQIYRGPSKTLHAMYNNKLTNCSPYLVCVDFPPGPCYSIKFIFSHKWYEPHTICTYFSPKINVNQTEQISEVEIALVSLMGRSLIHVTGS